jgi:hypothetical protein
MRNKYKVLVGRFKRNRPLRTPVNKLEDNIKIYLWETG